MCHVEIKNGRYFYVKVNIKQQWNIYDTEIRATTVLNKVETLLVKNVTLDIFTLIPCVPPFPLNLFILNFRISSMGG